MTDYSVEYGPEPGAFVCTMPARKPWPLPWTEEEGPVAWANRVLQEADSPEDGDFKAAMHLVGLFESVKKLEMARDEVRALQAENDRLREVVRDVVDHLEDYDLRRLVADVLLK